mmetsp:Transcript_176/g.403  ORF Transcript_176/g.403 Transcript_176/m.403 type:complete len:333 (-) Transcript_176:586-1584(-)
MLQQLLWCAPLLGVQCRHRIQQVSKLLCLLHIPLVLLKLGLHLLGPNSAQDEVRHALLGRTVRHDPRHLLSRNGVLVQVLEVKVLVKVLLPGHPALDHLVRDLAFEVHKMLQHVVVGLSREEDLASEQLKERSAHGKGVRRWPILGTESDLWCAVETAHQVRGGLHLGKLHGAAQITDLDEVVTSGDEDVVGLDVRMQDATPVDVPQPDEQLLGVGPDRPQRHALVLRVLFEGHPQIVPHALEDKAQVPTVGERPHKPDHVLLVALVRAVDLLEELDLLLGRLAHHVVATHDLDGHQLLVLLILGLDDIREDSLAAHGFDHAITAVHDLGDV